VKFTLSELGKQTDNILDTQYYFRLGYFLIADLR